MKHCLFGRRSCSLGVFSALVVVVSGLSAGPALAKATSSYGPPPDTSGCSSPQLSQPFLALGDLNFYTLVPGQSIGSFDGTGWTLRAGAQIETQPLADGASGSVLDLPSGSQAVSPPMCVSSDYPTGRTLVRDVVGSQGVQMYVSYAGTNTQDKPQNIGQVHGQQSSWTVSDPFNIHPGNLSGWQLVQFTLVPGGKTSDFQIYDFYVDPRMKG